MSNLKDNNLRKGVIIMLDKNKLSAEEMELVSGGSAGETADDSRFLNVLLQGRNGQCDRYGAARMRLEDHDHEIREAWAAAGVEATIHTGNILTSGFNNTYKINGVKVSRTQAMQHAMNVVGRQLKDSDWKW